MSAAVAQTNTSTETSGPSHTSTGRYRTRRTRHQSQRVVASASVPNTELIGAVVGKQGATINKIKEATHTVLVTWNLLRETVTCFTPSIFQEVHRA